MWSPTWRQEKNLQRRRFLDYILHMQDDLGYWFLFMDPQQTGTQRHGSKLVYNRDITLQFNMAEVVNPPWYYGIP